MRKLGYALAFIATFIVGGYAYHTATNIGPSDVSAYHKLEQELGGFRALPGDIVAVSPDGQRHQRICLGGATAETWDIVSIDAVYFNGLGQSMPPYIDVWGMLTGAIVGTAEAQSDSVPFAGDLRSLADEALPARLSSGCECAMARRLLQRERACTVHGALVERDSRLVHAIQFKTYSNFPKREVYEACGLDYNQNVEEIAKKHCTEANIPWDARWRHWLGLIEAQARVDDRQAAADPVR